MPAPTRGRNVKTTYRQNNIPCGFRSKTIRITEVGEEGWDQVNGDDTGVPFRVTDGWIIEITAYADDLKLLKAAVDDIANDANAVAGFDQRFGLRFDKLDGTSDVYVAYEGVRGLTNIDVSDRKATVMQTAKFMFKRFKPVSAA